MCASSPHESLLLATDVGSGRPSVRAKSVNCGQHSCFCFTGSASGDPVHHYTWHSLPNPSTTLCSAAPRLVSSALGAAFDAASRAWGLPEPALSGAMADKLDLESNPYETLGLGEGSAELTLPEIKKVRPRKQTAAASSRVRWLKRTAARAGVPAQGAGAAPRQAQVGAQPRCASEALQRLHATLVASSSVALRWRN